MICWFLRGLGACGLKRLVVWFGCLLCDLVACCAVWVLLVACLLCVLGFVTWCGCVLSGLVVCCVVLLIVVWFGVNSRVLIACCVFWFLVVWCGAMVCGLGLILRCFEPLLRFVAC